MTDNTANWNRVGWKRHDVGSTMVLHDDNTVGCSNYRLSVSFTPMVGRRCNVPTISLYECGFSVQCVQCSNFKCLSCQRRIRCSVHGSERRIFYCEFCWNLFVFNSHLSRNPQNLTFFYSHLFVLSHCDHTDIRGKLASHWKSYDICGKDR